MAHPDTGLLRSVIPFLIAGVAWIGMTRILPDGVARDLVSVVLGFGFAAAYLALLVNRVRLLLGHDGSVLAQLGLVLLDALLMVSAFALVYSITGLQDNTGLDPRTVHSFPVGLYYSVVTFTTLGYGDFYPVGAGRVLAAAEAAMGYVVLGVIASTAARLISPHSPAGGLDRPAAQGG